MHLPIDDDWCLDFTDDWTAYVVDLAKKQSPGRRLV